MMSVICCAEMLHVDAISITPEVAQCSQNYVRAMMTRDLTVVVWQWLGPLLNTRPSRRRPAGQRQVGRPV